MEEWAGQPSSAGCRITAQCRWVVLKCQVNANETLPLFWSCERGRNTYRSVNAEDCRITLPWYGEPPPGVLPENATRTRNEFCGSGSTVNEEGSPYRQRDLPEHSASPRHATPYVG